MPTYSIRKSLNRVNPYANGSPWGWGSFLIVQGVDTPRQAASAAILNTSAIVAHETLTKGHRTLDVFRFESGAVLAVEQEGA